MPARKTHGLSHVPEYHVWRQAKIRCTDPSNKSYKNYGGRGIWMCNDWLNSFARFYRDMGPRPEGMSLERIDNNGPYSPRNCRWATGIEQCANTRINKFLTLDGRSQTYAQWARELGLSYQTLHSRIKRNHIPPERALTSRRLRG